MFYTTTHADEITLLYTLPTPPSPAHTTPPTPLPPSTCNNFVTQALGGVGMRLQCFMHGMVNLTQDFRARLHFVLI